MPPGHPQPADSHSLITLFFTMLLRRAFSTARLVAEPPAALRRKQEHVEAALRIVHAYSTARYNESVDLSVVLNVDAKRSDERVRGMTLLPHGTGRTTRVAVFARGAAAEEARDAGADVRERSTQSCMRCSCALLLPLHARHASPCLVPMLNGWASLALLAGGRC